MYNIGIPLLFLATQETQCVGKSGGMSPVKEGMCPRSGDINRLMMVMTHLASYSNILSRVVSGTEQNNSTSPILPCMS
jgi:hypothetical protein